MASGEDLEKLYKFVKILALKVAQIVVQSRQGKKITHDCHIKNQPDNSTSPPSVQWFNLSIPDEPEVNTDTKRVLNGEVVSALTKILCIEISLHTSDGASMVLEIWTIRMMPGYEVGSVSTIYYRMSILLKSTLSISRITPAYKLSRLQHKECYKMYHKIYGGPPNLDLLGENYKTIKVSELQTPIGTILMEVVYRTNMTILPDEKYRIVESDQIVTSNNIMIKSDHFPRDTMRKNNYEKKEIDLSKPLTAGAFVDMEKIKELHQSLSQQLPPEPPMTWLLAEKEKLESRKKSASTSDYMDISKPSCSDGETASCSAPNVSSKAIDVPKANYGDKYTSLMEFPFADGSPITELANFYQECLQARSASDEWTDMAGEVSVSTDSEALSHQLRMFEEAVPEFDNMVASMFSNSEKGSENS